MTIIEQLAQAKAGMEAAEKKVADFTAQLTALQTDKETVAKENADLKASNEKLQADYAKLQADSKELIDAAAKESAEAKARMEENEKRAASIDKEAAGKAANILGQVGAAPIKGVTEADGNAKSSQELLAAYHAETDPVKRAEIFKQWKACK